MAINPRGDFIDTLGIKRDHHVCMVGVYPALGQLLESNCILTQVQTLKQMDGLLEMNKRFDRVIIASNPGVATNEVDDLLVIRSCQLLEQNGLIYFFCPVRSLAESFGKTVIKYYPSQNVTGVNTAMGAVMVTAARGNPESKK